MIKEALLGLYGRLPVPLQNAAISAWGLYSRRQRYGGRFPGALAELQRSEWWSADQIEAWQTERLREVVTRAFDRAARRSASERRWDGRTP
jgi:hypothetical protein